MKKRAYHYYIYKITFLKGNPINRYYIGKRSYYGFDIDSDSYTGSGTFCFAYFKKYGTVLGETYTKEILEVNESQSVNQKREEYWIGDLWETDPLCMNLCPGGYGSADHDTNCYVQDKYKKDIAQYDLYGNFIRSWHGIRECARELNYNRHGITACLTKRKPSAFGFQWTYWDGTENPIEPFYKIVYIDQYTRDGELIASFECPHDAEVALGINASSIRSCCNGERPSAGDYIWRFKGDAFNKYRTKLIDKEHRKPHKKKIRPILQYTLDGNFVTEFENIHAAIQKLNKSSDALIRGVADNDGRHKSAYGFIWKWKDEK